MMSRTEQVNLIGRNLALGERCGTDNLNLWDDTTISSLLPVESDLERRSTNYSNHRRHLIEVATLDSEVLRLGMVPDVLKLDVQGYELQVLRGGTETLGHGQVAIVACEVNFAGAYVGQAQFENLLEFMDDNGFRLWTIDRLVNTRVGNLYFADVTFVSKNVYKSLDGI